MITELQNHIEPCLNYCALTDIWKASVKATHDFVSADDIEFYSDRIPRDYMPQMDMYAGHGQWCAFIGLSAEMIEMLFVRPDSMGKGYGSTLLRFAVEQKGIRKVDVNEQNTARHISTKITVFQSQDETTQTQKACHTPSCISNSQKTSSRSRDYRSTTVIPAPPKRTSSSA